jgi:hypothetical protein
MTWNPKGDQTTNFTCRECGEWHGREWVPEHAARLRKEQLCHHCYFWHEKIHWMANAKDAARCVRTSDFIHFTIGDEQIRGSRGHSGRPFIVTFRNGGTVRTTNLWFQGPIPERFRDRLTPNADVCEEPLPPLDWDEPCAF